MAYLVTYSNGRESARVPTFRLALEATVAGDGGLRWIYRIEGRNGNEARVQIWNEVYGFSAERLTKNERKMKAEFDRRRARDDESAT